ncbi:MAG: PorV/PorQ family protein [Candidatus Krumholzibacteriia bacterium]
MRCKLLAGIGLISMLVSTSAFAVGEAGVPSLLIPPGARANGIGESYVALADDATAVWWNPGGLAFVRGQNLALMHSQLVPDLAPDVYYEYLGYTNQLSNFGTLSFGVVYLTYGESEGRDQNNAFVGTFKSWEGTLMASFAVPLTSHLGLGLTGKFIHVDLAPARVTVEQRDGSATSVAVDAGLLWKLPRQRLSIGTALTNLGPDISFIDQEQSDPLPFTFRVGAAYTAIADEVNNLLLAFDLEQSLVWLIDSETRTRRSEIYHVGAEYRYINLLVGRLGYVYDQDGDFKDPTYGLGFIYKEKVAFDYANVPQAETLDRVHRWSVVVSF